MSSGDHQVDNRALASALEQAAIRAGVEIRGGVAVEGVVTRAGQVVGVEIEGGESIAASSVVVAAGAWSRGLKGLAKQRPPVRPVKGQMLSLRFDAASPPLRHVVRNPYAYLVPKSGGRLIVGATSEEQGFDRRVMAGAVLDILKGAFDVLPTIYELELAEVWAGFRPGSRDNQPMLGGCDVEGLFFATGHYRNGIQQAPITINEVSRVVLGESPSALIAPFSIERFSGLQ
jgi:glycine oxidase